VISYNALIQSHVVKPGLNMTPPQLPFCNINKKIQVGLFCF